MSLKYQDLKDSQNNFSIDYQDPFFKIDGVQDMDSSRVVGYLQDLGLLRARSVIDTTLSTPPAVRITTTDVNPNRNLDLLLYNMDSVYIGQADDRYYLFSAQQIQPFLRDKSYFTMGTEDSLQAP